MYNICPFIYSNKDKEPVISIQFANAVRIIEEKYVSLNPSPCSSHSLRLIDNNLWCCYSNSCISVFDLEINHIRHIPIQDMGFVFSAVDIGDGAVVAAEEGLFLITYTGMFIFTSPSEGVEFSIHFQFRLNN